MGSVRSLDGPVSVCSRCNRCRCRWLPLLLLAACLGSSVHANPFPRGRPVRPLRALRQFLLLDDSERPGLADDTLLQLNPLYSGLPSKGKRSQQDQGLTREMLAQVLQPGGMWFGPRLGRRRRRRSAEASPRHRPDTNDDHLDEEGDLANSAAEDAVFVATLLKSLPAWQAHSLDDVWSPKRSYCESSPLGCLLASLRDAAATGTSEQQQPLAEGNTVNFTPRLGRESGEDTSEDTISVGPARDVRTHNRPIPPPELWFSEPPQFSPRLGRRLLPPGVQDVHAPPDTPPHQRQSRNPRSVNKSVPQETVATKKQSLD